MHKFESLLAFVQKLILEILHGNTRVQCIQHATLIINTNWTNQVPRLVACIGMPSNIGTNRMTCCSYASCSCCAWWSRIHPTKHQCTNWEVDVMRYIMGANKVVWWLCNETSRQLWVLTSPKADWEVFYVLIYATNVPKITMIKWWSKIQCKVHVGEGKRKSGKWLIARCKKNTIKSNSWFTI